MLKNFLISSGQRKAFWLLALIVTLVYVQVLGFDFVNWDDNTNIAANPEMIFPGFGSYWTYWSEAYGGLFVPVPFTVWTFVAQISQFIFREPYPVPAFYHGLNILVHLANTALVFSLLLALIDIPNKPKKKVELAEYENKHLWAALLGAAIFALHPMQVESVAWVTGFKDLIFGFFALLTLLSVYRHRMVAASVFYALALLSKPTAVILPFLAAWVLYVSAQKVNRQKIYFFVAWLVAAVPSFLVTRSVQSISNYTFFPSFWQKVVVAFDAVSFYVAKVLFPYPLSIDYGRNPKYMLENYVPNWMWFVFLAFAVVALIPWGRRLRIPHGFLFAVMTVGPVLGFVAFSYQITSTVADRYIYLGLIGFCLPVALALRDFPHRFVKPGVIAVLGVYCVLTFLQGRVWKDSSTLFTAPIEKGFPSSVARTQLAAHYSQQKKYDLAKPIFAEQMKLWPNDMLAYNGYAKILDKTGHSDEAIEVLKKSIAANGQFADTQTQMAQVLIDLNRIEEAVPYIEAAKKIDKNCYEAFYLEGNILAKKEKFPEAAEKYREAIKYWPNYPEAHNNLGNTLAILRDIRGAQLHFRIAAKLSPDYAGTHLNLARTLLMTGDYPEAHFELKRALSLDPSQGEARDLLQEMKRRFPGLE